MTLVRIGPPHTQPWYDARRRTVTASMSAHLMLGPDELPWHMPPERLAETIRTGVGPPRTVKMEAGTHFEAANLGWFGACAGRAVEPDGWLTVDTSRPWLGASLDARLGPPVCAEGFGAPEPALVVHDSWGRQYVGRDAQMFIRSLPDDTVVEAKSVESKNRSRYTKPSPPVHYECQVRHQMCVVGAAHGLLVTRVDAYELWVHHLERDLAWEARLAAEAYRFWRAHLGPEPVLLPEEVRLLLQEGREGRRELDARLDRSERVDF